MLWCLFLAVVVCLNWNKKRLKAVQVNVIAYRNHGLSAYLYPNLYYQLIWVMLNMISIGIPIERWLCRWPKLLGTGLNTRTETEGERKGKIQSLFCFENTSDSCDLKHHCVFHNISCCLNLLWGGKNIAYVLKQASKCFTGATIIKQ
jgi:hypothetical protein